MDRGSKFHGMIYFNNGNKHVSTCDSFITKLDYRKRPAEVELLSLCSLHLGDKVDSNEERTGM